MKCFFESKFVRYFHGSGVFRKFHLSFSLRFHYRIQICAGSRLTWRLISSSVQEFILSFHVRTPVVGVGCTHQESEQF